ncbi:hypothetical protein [Stackebrandtia soli]|uniref:hypothetical protein n=1 Tax=Stackebrandtia soli TaxID=1892856 RepID=UPI0039EC350A
MRLGKKDIATLTEWAKDERQYRIFGVSAAPFAAFAWWWLFTEFEPSESIWGAVILCPVALFGTILLGSAIFDLSRGRSFPQRILDGADPSIVYSAVVHRGDGDSPYPLSVRIDIPGDTPHRFVLLHEVPGLVVGTRLKAMGWGSSDYPFPDCVLLEESNGRRIWTRERPGPTSRYEDGTWG